ncbi:MAG: hypothetical protein V1862_12475 [Methanobacteriota archaeon]
MVNYFLSGYGLVAGHLKQEDVHEVIEEIRDYLDEYPEDPDIILAIDSLYTTLNDRDAAQAFLSESTTGLEYPTCMLRRARHYLAQGDTETGRDLLKQIILWDDREDLTRELTILLAHGLLDERGAFISFWQDLLERNDLNDIATNDNFLEYPQDFSLLDHLPYIERGIGLTLLMKYGVRPELELEAYALIASLASYLEDLVGMITLTAFQEGVITVYGTLPHAAAICAGARALAEEIYDQTGMITNEKIIPQAEDHIDTIQQCEQSIKILDILTDVLLLHGEYEGELLQVLRNTANGNDDKIITILSLFSPEELKETGLDLRKTLIRDNPDNLLFQGRTDQGRYQETFSYAARRHEVIVKPDLLKEAEADRLFEEGKMEEAAQLLCSLWDRDRFENQLNTVFFRSIRTGRGDDLIDLIPILETKDVPDKVYLLKGLKQLQNHNIKGAVSLIEKAGNAGLPAGYAMLGAAIGMNQAGYPKRSVGICEKLLKKSDVSPEEVYPVLIKAYRLLGKEKEAVATEKSMSEYL